ncbi:SRPBCC family protein [Raineyella sp. LH-20]|uniref:SRPBCC family protein n=1 Tax=Raineyella sp. LH-20 TaxID=3081204 RepID=UPI002952AEB2|nr:SRPBCC family protein [Raineyella sp. LH-20]WOP17505.1 SRPBCC family protein [Raineyella sp. LH-20]
MPNYSRTEIVDAKPSDIFAILDDVTRTPEWLTRCTQLDKLSEGPTAVGTQLTYHYKDGNRTGVMDGAVVAREQDRKLTHRFTDSMMDVTVDFDVEPGPTADQTKLTHTITIATKGFGKIFTPMIKRQLPGQTIGAMTALKALAESAQA